MSRRRASFARGALLNVSGDISANFESLPAQAASALSQLDATHKRGVADLKWLPRDCQVDYRGNRLAEEWRGDTSNQFVTISGDGYMLFWDVRYEKIAKGELPRVGRRAKRVEDKKSEKAKIPWGPLWKIQLKRPEGVGELSLCRLCRGFEAMKIGDDDKSTMFYCASEEGEIVSADWGARPAGSGSNNKNDDDDDETPEYVKWTAPDHSRPATVLQRSPVFPELVLSVGDWNFNVWSFGRERPIFSSPPASVALTTGCWSPTRPGMLYMGRADGSVDVWDLTDSSYRPATRLMVAPTKITSMRFLENEPNPKRQLLAVGDKLGNLHVFDVPRGLWRVSPGEEAAMSQFVQAEVDRMDYVEQRSAIRAEEAEAAKAAPDDDEDSPPSGGGGGGGGGGAPSAAAAAAVDDEPEFSPEELAEINTKYFEAQKLFAEKLGIELPGETTAVSEGSVAVEVA